MGCNDYNLHLEGSEGNESPTPEFKIYLDGVGVNGYSPTIDFVNKTSETFRIQVNDIDGTKLSDTIPLSSYIQGQLDTINNTLEGLDTTYLKVDGSNADNPITFGNLNISKSFGNATIDAGSNSLNLKGDGVTVGKSTSSDVELQGAAGRVRILNNYGIIFNATENKNIFLDTSGTGKAYYNNVVNPDKEIATVDQIPTVSDATITLTQGGVTKGTFTLNGSATTIDLDAGGSVITNPLHIGYTNGSTTYNLNLGVNETTSKVISSYSITTGGSSFGIPIRLLNGATSPLTLTEDVNGLYGLSLNIDDDTIKVNQDGELYAVGGGGATYTAGTGIDITSNVISVDNTVAMKTDIPDTTYMVTTNTAQTISGSKTFSSETHHTGVITFDSALLNPIIRGMSGSSYRNMIYRMGNDSAIIVGNSNDTIDLKGSGTRPTYNSNNLALYSDIPTVPTITTGSTNGTIAVGGTDISVYGLGSAAYTSSSDYVNLTTDQTVGGTKTFSNDQKFGGMIYFNGSSNAQGVVHRVGSTRKELVLRNNSASTVYVGNTSDALNLRGSGTRPSYYTNGTSKDIALTDDIPSLTNYVTTNTVQTITDVKTFTSDIILGDSNTYNTSLKAYNSNLDMNVACMQLYSSNNTLYIGNNGTTLSLRGDTTRPQYGSDDLALYSDISNLADKDLSNITTVNTQITTTAINPFVNKLTNADITVAPSADIDTGLLFRDNNDNNLAGFTTTRYTNGIQAAQMTAYNQISGTNKYSYLNVYVDSNGNDFTDASAGVKSTIANWAMPSATYTELTLGASGTTYTAPANGYFVCIIQMYVSWANMGLMINGVNFHQSFSNGTLPIGSTVPVKKGDILTVTYANDTYTPTKHTFRFYYAVGSESEAS